MTSTVGSPITEVWQRHTFGVMSLEVTAMECNLPGVCAIGGPLTQCQWQRWVCLCCAMSSVRLWCSLQVMVLAPTDPAVPEPVEVSICAPGTGALSLTAAAWALVNTLSIAIDLKTVTVGTHAVHFLFVCHSHRPHIVAMPNGRQRADGRGDRNARRPRSQPFWIFLSLCQGTYVKHTFIIRFTYRYSP